MRGSLVVAWPWTWDEIWVPLGEHEDAPKELFAELYPELVKVFRKNKEPEKLTVISKEEHLAFSEESASFFQASNDPALAQQSFRPVDPGKFESDAKLVHFFEQAYFLIEDYGSADLTGNYNALLSRFFDRYNLRFRVLPPCKLVPRFAGIYGAMIDRIVEKVSEDSDLADLYKDTEYAFEALAQSGNLSDVRTCISKASILAEGLAMQLPEVSANTLGTAAGEISCWPHRTIQVALEKIYGFCSDYPAIRHAGKPKGRLRDLEIRDAIIVSMLLLAYTGYFVDVDFNDVLCVRDH
jgi:hypothetical protein